MMHHITLSNGVFAACGVIVNQHAGALVEQQNMLVLIQDIQFGTDCAQRTFVLRGGTEELVLDEELDFVPLAEQLGLIRPCPVDFDFLCADEFIHQGGGQPPDRLGKEFIQPLSGVVPADFHGAHSTGSFAGNSENRGLSMGIRQPPVQKNLLRSAAGRLQRAEDAVACVAQTGHDVSRAL